MIRRAVAADAPSLTALAHAAKRHWRYPDEWIELWRRDLTLTPEFIERYPVYCSERAEPATASNRPPTLRADLQALATMVGFYALLFAAADCELEHFWVAPTHIGSGVGRRLFADAVARCRAIGAPRLWITADPNAEGFYTRMGARRIGAVASTPSGRTLPRLELPIARTTSAR
jgi:GNAT superfamily N-acetyltransferase